MSRQVINVGELWHLFAGPHIWLTFDDGPTPGTTTRIHDILNEEDVRGVFFVCGAYVQRWPHLVKQATDSGHLVGNHTWSHPRLTQLSKADIYRELVSTQDILFEMTRHRCRLFRPPWGALSGDAIEVASQLGLTTVLWSVSGGDWQRPGADTIVERVTSRVTRGAIVGLHDGCGDQLRPNSASAMVADREQTADALRKLIRRVRSLGLSFPPLPKCLPLGEGLETEAQAKLADSQ